MNDKRGTVWKIAAVLATTTLCAASVAWGATDSSSAGDDLNLSGTLVYYDTSGGAVTAAYKASVFPSFTDKTGVTIVDDFNNGDSPFFASVKAGRVPWSMVAFNTVADGLRAANKGYLLPLDKSIVPVDKLEPGAYGKYGIRGIVYGIILTWNTDKWPLSGKHPTSWKDFYNVEEFPGNRCLYESPQSGWVLESALLADGVSPDELYPLDVDRALKRLATIKDHTVWWSSGAESIQFLASGTCDMGIVWSGRVLSAVTKADLPLAVSWENAGYTSDLLAVPKDAPNPKAGFAFLAHWITDRESQITFVNMTGYPTSIKGLTLTDYDKSIRPFLAAGENLAKAIEENDKYYVNNIGELTKEFSEWLVGL